ncbi:MAG: hypothetical protein GOV02_00590 [Candidatus Aenigmarchaeota archaeon]|nr:hypothetical protein [Candidatus Aenigmarchaeota archaeon]
MKNPIKTIAKDIFYDPGKYTCALGLGASTVVLGIVGIHYAAKGELFEAAKGFGALVIPSAVINYKMNMEMEDSPYHVIKNAFFE